ncbi:bifunctional DNA-formamidopyrimidine glycosylase/DNA-(apurinic or apyrimidinic site) lyase [Patescibacteria group bacterium]|nr:bifunctional DNA-formamidopyrimidine glycosylase/DNA-(apurinic or apyrimidinic site) lyase [Patescibacteria group bacterium]MBU3999652.1 bifunctional DNA-formamidopyrimidine glycosylase/DNA-(apurinic or apyrimidinic site) lyase [Patescibacteria group bacterium]MBU4057167.1 bifunctional DNA-formamidopyrimidine glycosylase/DNA-(apurinic or apyrimidinic site) lyase [Patescibacteria group bacterium]MBU4368997.1 bifunctional DNA-formamidopyrimidine glycosylase/DNA-(apurinic or apyrimidinic site) l
MPELPEVETIKRELEKAILGKKITEVLVNNPKVIKEPKKEEFAKGLKSATIKNILRKGKLLIFELASGKSLAAHLKMTGQLIYPGDTKQSRVSFKLSDGKWLDFNDRRLMGELRLLTDWRALKFVKELGPEPFDLEERQFKKMLAGKKARIKPLIMDQTFISGMGNLYAAEALFKAKINPLRSAFSLSDKEKNALLAAIKSILKNAIKQGGSSVDKYVQLSGKPGGYVRYLKVYYRAGKPCYVCGMPIERIALAGRGTYYCPKCQK